MYTGTLIADLMATVERSERMVRQRRVAVDRIGEETELRQLFELQPPAMRDEQRIYAGAA
jgi:hypothetical protein